MAMTKDMKPYREQTPWLVRHPANIIELYIPISPEMQLRRQQEVELLF